MIHTLNNQTILFGVLFLVHSVFFINAIQSINNNRTRKIIVNSVALLLGIFITTLISFLLTNKPDIILTIALVEILFLPILIIGMSIFSTYHHSIHHNTQNHQLGVLILTIFISIFLFQEKNLFILTLIIAMGIAMVAWELYFSNEYANELVKQQEKVNGTKTEFLSFATHQLRSPLTQIKWGLNAITDQVSSQPEILSIVQQLRITTDEMIDTINDLLDISKIEQHGLVLKNDTLDLIDLIDLLTQEFTLIAKAKNLAITFQKSITVAPIIGDNTKLRQVFINIIDNAIKYTTTGSIIIRLDQHPTNPYYNVSIIDTGAGIAPEEIPKLFTKFSRGNAGRVFMESSGIGLYLAKKIVELHKGTISVQSKGIGLGSTFTISLPQK